MRARRAEVALAMLMGEFHVEADWVSPERGLRDLRRLTGQDFGHDVDAWRAWLWKHDFVSDSWAPGIEFC